MMKIQMTFKYIAVMPMVLFTLFACHAEGLNEGSQETEGGVIVIESETQFYEHINGDTPVLVDFHADWCRPCRIQGPIVKDVSEEMAGKLVVLKLDVDAFPRLASKYQVRSIPTLILYKEAESLWKGIGLKQKAEIQAAVNARIGDKD
jgi:thioredoxin 1